MPLNITIKKDELMQVLNTDTGEEITILITKHSGKRYHLTIDATENYRISRGKKKVKPVVRRKMVVMVNKPEYW
jgi:hypothetical protein